ncbi:MAG: putative Ig domain-containing protein [Synergistaceae bacterium]|nr:putative Ig domain-containing protein [Synergistaceae bacterium]
MKKLLFFLLLVVLFSCPAFANSSEYVEGEVLVVIDAPESGYSAFSVQDEVGVNAFSQSVLSEAQAFAEEFDLEALETYPEIANISGKSIIHLRSEYMSTEELIQELSSVPYVESVSPNHIIRLDGSSAAQSTEYAAFSALTPNDPYYSLLWGLTNIGVQQVWDYVTGSDTICVAVLDTGINYTHPDLSANMAKDTTGYYGRYFKNGVVSTNPMDTHGHGTHVAGTIGAVGNNGIGVVGVNWKVKLLAVSVIAGGSGSEADIIKGINYVVSEKRNGLNIRVVNMSLGGWYPVQADNSPYGNAIKSMSDVGIICALAAGNDGQNLSNPTGVDTNGISCKGRRPYPACFRFVNTITVGSIGSGNGKSIFSNYSPAWVDIAAPGENIYSTYLSNGYRYMDGTSMATPHVAGAAALLCAAYPGETPAQIKARILNNANNIGTAYWAKGILNAWGAYSNGAKAPIITTTSLPGGTVGKAYSATLSASGTTPITWSVSANSLPNGLILNAATGVISGTPTTVGTFSFTVKAANIAGSATKNLSIVISPEPPKITTTSLPGGTVNKTYSATLSASGTTPITWSISAGSLPVGLSLNAATGVISGTPTKAGTTNFTVKATNGGGSDTKALSIVVSIEIIPPTITTTSLPGGVVGTTYNQALSASGTTPITWSVSAGSLPVGLSLNGTTGVISGLPSMAGTFNFTVKAANTAGSDAKNLSIVISPKPVAPVITTSSLPGGVVGKAYSETLTASGTAPINWSISSGSLPPGLSLNTTTGVISGTPTTAGTYNFTVKATNVAGSVTKSFSIVISTLPVVTKTSLPAGTVGVFYTQTLTASGTTPITWSISSGSLPPGLNLNATTGVISGTPTKAGAYNFTVKATNAAGSATKDLSIVINPAPDPDPRTPPKITITAIPIGYAGDYYSMTFSASGTAPISWSISGSLPPGLTINFISGVISGTPTTAGTFSFTLKASNAAGSATANLSITIRPVPPAITTSNLPGGVVGAVYNQMLSASGTAPITWSVASGNLPTGLILSASTGTISGIALTAGAYNFSVKATNTAGSAAKNLSIVISSATLPVITTYALPGGNVGAAYSQTLNASGTAPITWSVSGGSLPSGLNLSNSGTISGKPTAGGTYNFTVKAANAAGSAAKSFSIVISASVAPTITTSTLPGCIVGTSISIALSASGSTPITWSISGGSLPLGLILSTTTGVISGTPATTGTFSFTVKAANSVGSATKALSIVVSPSPLIPPKIGTSALPKGITNVAYNLILAASGSAPITWSVSGSFPPGLMLNPSTGLISGKPAMAGTFTFTARAANAAGSDAKSLSIIVTSSGLSAGMTDLPEDVLPQPEGDIAAAIPQYSSNMGYAATRMVDVNTADLETADGNVVINKSVAEAISKKLLGVNNVRVVPLPWFEAAVQSGKIAAVKIPVSGAQLNTSHPKDILLLKIISSETGEFLEYAATDDDYDDGRFTLLEKGSETPYSGNINPDAEYDLMIFIKDGGRFDLDKTTDGFVIDPTAIVNVVHGSEIRLSEGSASERTKASEKTSGGCNAGYVSFSFVLLGTALISIRKK